MTGQTAGQDPFVAGYPSVERQSFVVRIWREEGDAGWRGWVQHTRTQKSATVESLKALLDFVERQAGNLTGTAPKNLR
jgi:hypothetical protein